MPLLPRARRAASAERAAAARARLERILRPESAARAVPAVVDAELDASAESLTPAAGLLLDPTRRGAVALGSVALAAAAVTGLLVWRSRPQPVTVAPPTVVASAGVDADASAEVIVDVQGAVRRPGLVTLPAGARVADALAAAGGLAPGASTVGLNLARRVSDGEQVVVLPPGTTATPAAAAGATGIGAAGGLLDLNLATLEQLDALPGVGPVTAQRIIAWRTEHGRFASVDQLREVDGIGDRRFEQLRGLVVV